MKELWKMNHRELAAAAAAGDLDRVRAILDENGSLARHWQPILDACLHGQAAVVRELLARGADVEAVSPSEQRYRPLQRAVEHRGVARCAGHRECVELLIEAGADLSARCGWQQTTALCTAARVGDRELVELLTRAGAEVDLYAACALGLTDRVDALTQENPAAAAQADTNGMTPLHYCASSGLGTAEPETAAGLKRCVELLIARGADPSRRSDIGHARGLPVIHMAAPANRAVVEALLAAGVDPTTGLGSFLWGEPNDLTELLYSRGADVDTTEDDGVPLLVSRVHWGHTTVVLWLLEKGADPNRSDRTGRTALHAAAARGAAPRLLEALVARGADPGARNAAGETPLEVAVRKGKQKAAAWLSVRAAPHSQETGSPSPA